MYDRNDIRLREMIALASFEEGRGRREKRIGLYYRSDYIALQMIQSFFLTTLGFILAAILLVLWLGEGFLDGLVKMDFGRALILTGIAYILTLAVFLVITYILARGRYRKARKAMGEYGKHLKKLAE